MATFDERFTGATDDQSSQDQIAATPQYKMVPIDFDPFNVTTENANTIAANRVQRSVTKRDNAIPVSGRSEELTTDTADKLYGLHGRERYQFFPEVIARNIGDVVMREPIQIDPETGYIGFEQVSKAMDVAGLMGGATLGIKPGAATLGSGAVRPMLNATKNEVAPAFYSAVEYAVTNIQQPKMTGQQWLGTLANRPGVKPEELDWIGLKQYLLNNAEKVITKPEVEAFVKQNKVELKEVDKGGITDPDRVKPDEIALAKYKDAWERNVLKINELKDELKAIPRGDMPYKKDGLNRQIQQLETEREALHRRGVNDTIERLGGLNKPTRYGPNEQPKLSLPGGENYREKLLTLPDPNGIRAKLDPINKRMDEITNLPAREHTPEITKEWDDLNTQRKALMYDENGNVRTEVHPYKSSHWEEPNVLAHVRMNDRMIEGKKALHIEEIQSDWHQAGRDKGYVSQADKPAFDKIYHEELPKAREHLANVIKDIDKEHGLLSTRERLAKRLPIDENRIAIHKADPRYKKAEAKIAKLEDDLSRANPVNKVPDAPFKKSWHELALKRMLREAAEKGYDRLSWTPGEAQAARYDLSQQVNALHYRKNTDGTYALQADLRNGTLHNFGNLSENKLADNVGKDVAKEIIESKGTESSTNPKHARYGMKQLTGQELKVGGEGMKGFYDQIIPKAIEKIGKEHGVKVKQGNLDKNANSIHYIDIPQSLKDHAMKRGFPLFSSSPLLVPVDYNPFEKKQ